MIVCSLVFPLLKKLCDSLRNGIRLYVVYASGEAGYRDDAVRGAFG